MKRLLNNNRGNVDFVISCFLIAFVLSIIGFIYFINPANRDKFINYFSNKSASITCYSGTKMIYQKESEGKPKSESGSDGYAFREKETGLLVEVSGNCVIRYTGDKE